MATENNTPPTDPTIQSATAADLDALMHLEQASFQGGEAFSRRQYQALLANPQATIRVIRAADLPAGQLAAAAVLLRRRTRGGLSARLYTIAVNPACRGQGLGNKLMSDLIDLCRAESIARLHLEVRSDNQAAIALYRKFGFELDRHLEHYYGAGQHGVKMVLAVKPGFTTETTENTEG